MKNSILKTISYISVFLSILSVGLSVVYASSNSNAQITPQAITSRKTTKPHGNLTYNGFRYKLINNEISITAGSVSTGNVVIPSEIKGYPVTSIAHSAFSHCSELTSITIPETVTSIGNSVFSYSENLKKIIVSPENTHFLADEEGVLFNKNKTELIYYPAGNSNTEYVIPDSVETIKNTAFEGCNRIHKLTLGKSIQSIGIDNFMKMENIESVFVSSENNYFSNDAYGILFSKDKTTLIYCPSKNSVTDYVIPESVSIISDNAFYKNQNLVSIVFSDNIINTGIGSFEDCPDLSKVTFGSNLEIIDKYAFYNCNNLKTIIWNNSLKSINQNAFRYCDTLESLTLPDSVKTIEDSAFYGCSGLNHVVIPDSVETIGKSAFSYCQGIVEFSVSLKNKFYSSDNHGVLFNKDKTILLDYPSGNKQAEYYIPDSVIVVENVFENCNNLLHITIGKSVETIDSHEFSYREFSGCENLERITVSNQNNNYSSDSYGVLFNKDKTELILFPPKSAETSYVIPDSVTLVGSRAFCNDIKEVIFPKNLKEIGFHAFYGCQNLSNVILPESLESICDEAFHSCINIKSIIIPKNVTHIGFCSLGFAYNSLTRGGDGYSGSIIPGFKIFCYADTAGFDYATEHGIDYEIITDPEKQITINQKEININYKETLKLSTDVSGSSENTIVWQSSNPEVATVDENGNITAVGSGTATITATIEGTDISDSCKVTVSYAWWQWLIRIFLLGFIWY